jgi:Tetratricopeptide repeat
VFATRTGVQNRGHRAGLGTDHPTTLDARRRLGEAYTGALRAAEAIAVLKPVTAAMEQAFGPDSRVTFSTRGSLARAYYAAGRLHKSAALYRQVLSDYERTLGPEHAMTRRFRDIVGQLPGPALRTFAAARRITGRWRPRPS